jgi:thioredoxin 1
MTGVRPHGSDPDGPAMRRMEDITDETFADEVLATSAPVIVDFWAPWCKPCDAIEPHLRAIAEDSGGRIRLVRMNVDENLAVPGRYGVLALPTVMLFADGEPRLSVYGAHSRVHYERAFAAFLDSEPADQ